MKISSMKKFLFFFYFDFPCWLRFSLQAVKRTMDTPCDAIVKRMLGHLLAFEYRTAHRDNDNSAAQSAQDFFRNVNRLGNVCPGEQGRVAAVLKKYQCTPDIKEDLREYNLTSLWRASPSVQKELILRRPFWERMRWRLAFAYPDYVDEPNWWT